MKKIQIIPELRSAHIERFRQWGTTDLIMYRSLKWDLKEVPKQVAIQKLTVAALLREILSGGTKVVELPEPLWIRQTPWTALVISLWSILAKKRTTFITYCIENNEIEDLLGWRGPLQKPLELISLRALNILIVRKIDRFAFGSETAKNAYGPFDIRPSSKTETFLELPCPAPRSCGTTSSGVIFVGILEKRKGLEQLVRAWEVIENSVMDDITIVGSGPLESMIVDWVAINPVRRHHIPQLPHSDLEEKYLSNRILVAPSIREGRWREQIGLPIKEALRNGLTIVSTLESGLSEWLLRRGHYIGPIESLPLLLLGAAKDPIDPFDVIKHLPKLDGRKMADEWMHQ